MGQSTHAVATRWFKQPPLAPSVKPLFLTCYLLLLSRVLPGHSWGSHQTGKAVTHMRTTTVLQLKARVQGKVATGKGQRTKSSCQQFKGVILSIHWLLSQRHRHKVKSQRGKKEHFSNAIVYFSISSSPFQLE